VVFVSSVKVHGDRTTGRPFSEIDLPAPAGGYAVSKWEGEQTLREVAQRSGIEVVVVRPPLVYGPGVKANFARLVEWVRRGRLLPFGAIENRRSLVALPNLVDLLARCVTAPEAEGRTFLVSDGDAVSTPTLVREIAEAMGRAPRLVSISPAAIRLVGRLSGKRAEIERLCGSLEVDMERTCRVLDWAPPVNRKEALRSTVGAAEPRLP
jgi:nucleoside-diphosphate-sugar epimerase